jgi:glutamine amidotransferase
MIVIVDYEVGNLGSVQNMFKKVGASAVISKDPAVIAQASKILLPGIGRFDFCMQALKKSGLIPILEKKVLSEKVPTLGICVGFQLLAQKSEEGDVPGLGWIPAVVKKFRFRPDMNLKVPHMGWNWVHAKKDSPLTHDLGPEPRFYFAHSYFMETAVPDLRLLQTDYGETFTSAIQN